MIELKNNPKINKGFYITDTSPYGFTLFKVEEKPYLLEKGLTIVLYKESK